MFKSIVRAVLDRIVHRELFNDSPVYQTYTRMFFPRAAERRSKEIRFYGEALDKDHVDLIFDIGANAGSKTDVFLRYANRVICVEPNPKMIRSLEKRYSRNPKVIIVKKACGSFIGLSKMQIFEDNDAYGTLSPKWHRELVVNRRTRVAGREIDVPTTTLDELIDGFGKPHYVKIDVEGFELEVIKGLSHSVSLISFECNLPTFKNESLEIIQRLSAMTPDALFNFSCTEPPELFEMTSWLGATEIADAVASDKYGFMEIFCRNPNVSAGSQSI